MGWWIFLNFHNFSAPCFIHPWMEYLFVTQIQIHPNNKPNGWEAGYERVNSSSYSSSHETVSRKRLRVTCQCRDVPEMIPNQYKVKKKMFSVHRSVHIFLAVWMRTGSGSLWLLTVSSSQARDNFSWAGSRVRAGLKTLLLGLLTEEEDFFLENKAFFKL